VEVGTQQDVWVRVVLCPSPTFLSFPFQETVEEEKGINIDKSLPLACHGRQENPHPSTVQLQIDAIYENFCALNCKYKCTSVQSLSFLCTSPSYAKAISLFWQVCFRFRPNSYLDFPAFFFFYKFFVLLYTVGPRFLCAIRALCGKLSALQVIWFAFI